jgi:hypothetical protein
MSGSLSHGIPRGQSQIQLETIGFFDKVIAAKRGDTEAAPLFSSYLVAVVWSRLSAA